MIATRTRRPLLTALLATGAVAAALVGVACSQIIGADADVVECTVAQADRCNDGNPCTNDSCTRGRCFHDQIAACGTACTSAADCDDGIPCTDDICYARSECRHAPKLDCEASCTTASDCDDGSRCTNDMCVDGRCRNDAVDCSGLDGPCRKGVCSPVSGECVSEACSTAIDPVTCTSYACNEATQQCDEIKCEDTDANPCTITSCVDGMCTASVLQFQPIDTSPTDCIYDVYCDEGGAPIYGMAADYEIPAEDGDPSTIEYCANGRTVLCSRGTYLQPVCTTCNTIDDCPEIPCQTRRNCLDGTCFYDGIDGAPDAFCDMCRNGGCEVSPGVTCWPMEPQCCNDAGTCCGPTGCTDASQMPLLCDGCAGAATPCSYPVCEVDATTCNQTFLQFDNARCSGGFCLQGACINF